MSQNDFFISHATNDSKLVNQFMKFLQLTLGVNRQTIYCTSANGTNSIGIGDNFIENIKAHVTDTKMVIFIFTPNYFKSNFCIAELGAAWVLNRNIYPIIIPPTDKSILGTTPLGVATQALTLNTAKDIVKIADDFRKKGIAEYSDIGYVNECAEELMTWIKTNCKFETDEIVSKDDYSSIQSEVEKLRKAIHLKDMHIAQLASSNKSALKFEKEGRIKESGARRLVAAKQPVKINTGRLVIGTNSVKENKDVTPKWELFDEHVKNAKDVLRKLDDIVISAIYYNEFLRGEVSFWPVQNDDINWQKFNELRADKMIFVDEDDHRITPNYEEILVDKAVNQLYALDRFVSYDVDEEMGQEFAEKHEFNLNFKSKRFWEDILNVKIFV